MWAAGLNVMYRSTMAELSAARSVLRMLCRVVGPVIFRNGFISASFARSASSRARSAAGRRLFLPHLQRAACSRRAWFSAAITSLSSAMASNISTR